MGCHFHPPVIIAVGYDPAVSWHRETDGKDHGEIDATTAATQMMLQAAGIWALHYVGWDCLSLEKMLAAFPEMAGVQLTALLPLGYPAEGAHPAKLHAQREPMEKLVKYL